MTLIDFRLNLVWSNFRNNQVNLLICTEAVVGGAGVVAIYLFWKPDKAYENGRLRILMEAPKWRLGESSSWQICILQ